MCARVSFLFISLGGGGGSASSLLRGPGKFLTWEDVGMERVRHFEFPKRLFPQLGHLFHSVVDGSADAPRLPFHVGQVGELVEDGGRFGVRETSRGERGVRDFGETFRGELRGANVFEVNILDRRW